MSTTTTESIGKSVVAKQRAFFNTNATKDVQFRIDQLKKLRQAIASNEERMFEAIHKDFGKSAFDTWTNELSLIYEEIDDCLKHIKKWSKKQRVKTNVVNWIGRSYRYPEPLGVSLVIGAWNYPYQLSLAPTVGAIAAGCTVVLKPSELTSHTSTVIKEIISSTFDESYFAVVEGGIPETQDLLDQHWDKIFFTGSVPVGKIIYQAAAKHLTPVTLELGGKSPAIIMDDAELPITIQRLVWGKFLNSGQTCIAPDYVMVHKSLKTLLIDGIRAEINKRAYAVENDNFTQIINERNLDRLISLIDKDKVVIGGKVDRERRIIEPTVLSGVTFEDDIMKDEIFGPILPIITFSSIDDAIQQIKSLDKPLSLYLFTKKAAIKEKVLKEISFGGGVINDTIMHITNPNLPFGGVGSSGIGSYHGVESFKAFSHYKSILERSTLFELDLKYPPYSASKLKWIKRFIKL